MVRVRDEREKCDDRAAHGAGETGLARPHRAAHQAHLKFQMTAEFGRCERIVDGAKRMPDGLGFEHSAVKAQRIEHHSPLPVEIEMKGLAVVDQEWSAGGKLPAIIGHRRVIGRHFAQIEEQALLRSATEFPAASIGRVTRRGDHGQHATGHRDRAKICIEDDVVGLDRLDAGIDVADRIAEEIEFFRVIDRCRGHVGYLGDDFT
jgi:hypothetical protein